MPKANCFCRKPNVGLLVDYLKDPNIDWQRSAVVGDRNSDLELAENLGIEGFILSENFSGWTWSQVADELIKKPRKAKTDRKTSETSISAVVNIDGQGQAQIESGIPFFDHMVEQLAYYSKTDIELKVEPGTQIDLSLIHI